MIIKFRMNKNYLGDLSQFKKASYNKRNFINS